MKYLTLLLSCFLTLGSVQAVTPGGLQWYFSDPGQMGMGFTGIASSSRLSMASVNPGAMVFSRSSGIQAGFSAMRPATTFLETSPSVYLDTSLVPTLTPLFLNSIFYVNKDPESRRIAFGFAVNQPFGVSMTWPESWKGKFIAQEFTINTYFAHLSASIRVNEKLGVGIGGSYGALTLLSRRALEDTDGQDLDVGSASLSGSDLTWGLFAGLHYRISESSSFSALLTSPMRISILNGTADFSVPASLENLFPSQSFQTSFWLPPRLDLGVTLQPKPRMTINIAANITGWQLMDSLVYLMEDPVESLNQYPETGFANTLALRMGSEYFLNEYLSLRGGIYLENTPVSSEQLSPEFPDGTRIGLTTGLGYRLGSIELDAAYQFAFTGERTGIHTEAGFGGTYKSNTQALSMGISYIW